MFLSRVLLLMLPIGSSILLESLPKSRLFSTSEEILLRTDDFFDFEIVVKFSVNSYADPVNPYTAVPTHFDNNRLYDLIKDQCNSHNLFLSGRRTKRGFGKFFSSLGKIAVPRVAVSAARVATRHNHQSTYQWTNGQNPDSYDKKHWETDRLSTFTSQIGEFFKGRVVPSMLYHQEFDKAINNTIYSGFNFSRDSVLEWRSEPKECFVNPDITISVRTRLTVPAADERITVQKQYDIGSVYRGVYSYYPISDTVLRKDVLHTVALKNCTRTWRGPTKCGMKDLRKPDCTENDLAGCEPVLNHLNETTLFYQALGDHQLLVGNFSELTFFNSSGFLTTTVKVAPNTPVILEVASGEYVDVMGQRFEGNFAATAIRTADSTPLPSERQAIDSYLPSERHLIYIVVPCTIVFFFALLVALFKCVFPRCRQNALNSHITSKSSSSHANT